MSYRSNIAIGMIKEDGDKFLSDYEKVSACGFMKEALEVKRYNDAYVFYWKNVLWYDDDEEVQWIENCVRKLYDEEKPMAFIRVGQDLSDNGAWFYNDDAGILWSRMWLSREISFAPNVA